MNKNLKIGKLKGGEKYIWVEVNYDGNRLSIVGYIKFRNGIIDSCGQIKDEIIELYANKELELFIGREIFLKLMDIWDKWHLNDLKAGCKHQERLIKHLVKIYGLDFFKIDNIMKIKEFNRCSICGYRYGSKWLKINVPEKVIKFLNAILG